MRVTCVPDSWMTRVNCARTGRRRVSVAVIVVSVLPLSLTQITYRPPGWRAIRNPGALSGAEGSAAAVDTGLPEVGAVAGGLPGAERGAAGDPRGPRRPGEGVLGPRGRLGHSATVGEHDLRARA